MTGNGAASAARASLLERMMRGEGQRRGVIPVRPQGARVPLAFQQQRLWFLDQLIPNSAAANVDVALRLSFPVDAGLLARAVNAVIDRHEALRTVFSEVDGEAEQVVVVGGHITIPLVDLSNSADPERAAREAATVQARLPFDLTRGPLLRATLFRTAPADHVFAVTVHHAVADGWSMRLFFTEIAALYTALGTGRPSPLPDLPIQYGDYALWQRAQLTGARLEEHSTFWRAVLDRAPVTELPADRPRPPVQTFTGATHTFTLPAGLCDRIRSTHTGTGTTAFMALLAGFGELLRRYTGQPDLVLGTYTAGRSRVELEPLIGFFVNTLVLRLDYTGDPTYRQALHRVRETCLSAFDHQDLPFEKLVEILTPPRDLSRNPLCQIAFQVVSGPAGSDTAAPSNVIDVERGTASFDLVLSVRLHAGGADCRLEYSTDLYDAVTVQRLAVQYRRLLEAATAEPDRPLHQLDVLDDQDRAELTAVRHSGYPTTSLRTLFDRRAVADPQAVAVLAADGTPWTYAGLRSYADGLAARLVRQGVRRGDVVGVLMRRSPEWVATAVAVAGRGATYLPLDPALPADRLAGMAEDAGAAVLIGRGAELAQWTGPAIPTVDVDRVRRRPDGAAGARPVTTGPDDPAYVLFTSGSTGRPKGVVAPLRQMLNRLEWMWSELPFAPGEVQSARTPIGFVDSLWELWGGLLAGVPTAIIPESVQADADGLLDALRRTGATRVWMVPSLLRALLSTGAGPDNPAPGVRMWVVSGEPLPPDLAHRFHATCTDTELINIYGTSEVWDATWHRCRPGEVTAPIGRPLPNVGCYVADTHGTLAPRGAAGELWVGGDGVALGYLGAEHHLAERFADRPAWGAGRCYRTGDLARWNTGGELELLGRLDDQVKIRGVRVEPGEIETALATLPGATDVAVAAHTGPSGFTSLTAYVVMAADVAAPTMTALRRHLSGRVPDPVVPTRLVVLDALPRTSSGKLDRRALPDPPATTGRVLTEPDGPMETVVRAVWSEILDTDRIGAHENFFELGGHSLLATQIVARLRRIFPVELPLQTFFETPTVAGLAAVLSQDPRSAPAAQVAARLLAMTDDEVAAALAVAEEP